MSPAPGFPMNEIRSFGLYQVRVLAERKERLSPAVKRPDVIGPLLCGLGFEVLGDEFPNKLEKMVREGVLSEVSQYDRK